MSVQDTIQSMASNIEAAYTALAAKNATIPQNKNLENLSTAIGSITSGGTNKLPSVVDKSVTQITASDLSGATSIGNNAFSSCTSLTSITIPDSVTSIGSNAFSSCSGLTSVTIPDSVTSVGEDAFNACSGLTSVYYESDVASWCGISFAGLYSNPLQYAHNLYINNELVTEIVIPDTVTEIKSYAFKYWNGTSVTIGNSVTSIGNYAFCDCRSLTSITIPDSVTSIASNAFRDCRSLTSITIPDSVTSIGSNAFSSCRSLTSITITATTPPDLSNTSAFASTNNCPIYVPAGSVTAYQSATNWAYFASRIQAIPA